MRFLFSLGIISALSSCGMNNYSSASEPSMPSYGAPSSGSLNRNSVSTTNRIVVKTGSLNMDAGNVRETGERIEQIIASRGGHMLSYSERDDKRKSSSFSIRVPAENLVQTMDEISNLGKVSYRRISVTDKTRESIAQKARLAKLKQRRSRLEAMYRSAKVLKDKLELEETLADLEEQIFSMEEGARQIQKFARFSTLDVSLSQKTIRGPVGAALDGVSWTWGKLFTIRR